MRNNSGHGHVHPRPDGVKARCGGPTICSTCARELAEVKRRDSSNGCDHSWIFIEGDSGTGIPDRMECIKCKKTRDPNPHESIVGLSIEICKALLGKKK